MLPWLTSSDFQPLACPLFTLVRRPVQPVMNDYKRGLGDKPKLQAIILSSAQTPPLLAKLPHFLSLCDVPCYCVGEKTATAAKAAGFLNLYRPPLIKEAIGVSGIGPVVRLMLEGLNPSQGWIIHAGGSLLAGNAEEILRAQGYDYFHWKLYSQRHRRQISPEAWRVWQEDRLYGVMLFSPEQARHFSLLTQDSPLPPNLTSIYTLSKKVAEGLASRYKPMVRIVTDSSESAWLNLLAQSD